MESGAGRGTGGGRVLSSSRIQLAALGSIRRLQAGSLNSDAESESKRGLLR
jgi:hypothetical protein